jgi:hypothetical protein
MIVNSKTKTYTPENWKEHFQVFISRLLVIEMKEGSRLPRFYLPIWRPADKYAFECWILPLAPFVWLWRVIDSVFWNIWSDMQDLAYMLWLWRNRKLKEREK